MSKIVKCTCVNTGQDKIHGKGNRVANETSKAPVGKITVRCTVCLKKHIIGESDE